MHYILFQFPIGASEATIQPYVYFSAPAENVVSLMDKQGFRPQNMAGLVLRDKLDGSLSRCNPSNLEVPQLVQRPYVGFHDERYTYHQKLLGLVREGSKLTNLIQFRASQFEEQASLKLYIATRFERVAHRRASLCENSFPVESE